MREFEFDEQTNDQTATGVDPDLVIPEVQWGNDDDEESPEDHAFSFYTLPHSVSTW